MYSDNLFMSPQSPISVLGFGMTPGLIAEWSNGIHSTTLYGHIDRQVFPTDNPINTFDSEAGFTQKYEALRDLTFSVRGDYSHHTISSGLQNSIPSPLSAVGTTTLPNGNTYDFAERDYRLTVRTAGRTGRSDGCSQPGVIREPVRSIHRHILGQQDTQSRYRKPEWFAGPDRI
jgi:hypothetical protein